MKRDYAVVIVTYNRELLLRECVRQVEQQTVSASKIIIVNNASTDGTRQYLKELSRKNSVYQIIECSQNLGGAGGFARGIAYVINETVINPPAELGRLTDAGGGEQSIKIENSAV